MDEDNDNNRRATNRMAAETFMPMMVEAFHDGLREAGSLSRWLLATLVAINGAAAISMLPLKMATAGEARWGSRFPDWNPGGLGAGIWSLYAFKRVSTSAGTMLGYWLTVVEDGSAPRSAGGDHEETYGPGDWLARDPFLGIRERRGISPRLRLRGVGTDSARGLAMSDAMAMNFDLTPPADEQFQDLVSGLSEEERHLLLDHGGGGSILRRFSHRKARWRVRVPIVRVAAVQGRCQV